jgi:hypothetical protein
MITTQTMNEVRRYLKEIANQKEPESLMELKKENALLRDLLARYRGPGGVEIDLERARVKKC